MPSNLDFDSTKRFRDYILGKTLNQPNGPQTYTSGAYTMQNLSDLPNRDLGNVDNNRVNDLIQINNTNTFKPTEFFVNDTLNTLPRKADLSLYPYFTSTNHNLIGIMGSENNSTESELYRFASSYIKLDPNGPVLSRITRNIDKATNGKVRLLDALNGNTTTAINIITGREPLVESNYDITVAKTLPGKAIDFLQTVSGVEFPFSEIPGDYLSNPSNPINYRPVASTEVGKLWQDVTGVLGSLVGIQRRPKLSRKPSDLFIEHMGQGQKNALFHNLSFSKYAPNYTTTARSQNTSKIFNFVDRTAQGIKSLLGTEAPAGVAYIGDDRGNDVKYAMNDFNDRPVRGSYYLSLMFDEVSANLFHKSKNITEGGSIGGNLTWTSKNSKNKLGQHNAEWSGESSILQETLSTKYGFREDSILGHTQEILDSMPSDGGAARSHVANVIDQTSRVFGEGDLMISRGSAVKFIDKFSGTESGVEYCRVWTKDRSYLNYSDTMKRTANIRKYDGSVMGGQSRPWNLNIAPMSNGKKSFDQSTNIFNNYPYGGGFYAKKYMFSIENLAWKTSNTDGFRVTDLPACEKGNNGGRVMWFPPYDLKVSEQNSARWEENSFLGRPEPIYTYQNTSRTGQISFKVVVDHPSILNLLVREHFKGMSDEESDNYINAFFAGCVDLDFYSLIQTYTTLDSDDVKRIKEYLNAGKDKQTIKKYKYVTEQVETKQNDTNGNKTIQPEPFDDIFYFPNDVPKFNVNNKAIANSNYGVIKAEYLVQKNKFISDLDTDLTALLSDNSADAIKDIKTIFNKTKEEVLPISGTSINLVKDKISSGFDTVEKNYNDFATKVEQLKIDISGKTVSEAELRIVSSTSEVANDKYNFYLGVRRGYSILSETLSKLSNGITIDEKFINWFTVDYLKQFEKTGLTNAGPLKYPFRDLGYDVDGSLNVFFTTTGENTVLSNGGSETNLNCKQVIHTKTGLKDEAPVAFFCRQANVKLKYNKIDKPQDIVVKIPKIKVEPDGETTTGGTPKPSIDVMKRIIMKTLSECHYFKKLEEDSPVAFKSMTEKLKYFHPGFHSTTPEGLNSRLTFLLQCVRPGDTIPIKGLSDNTDVGARNTTFGPPPICVLRIGDFYHSKIVIRDVNISYDDSPWDLNPEGIGVQPMIATVTMQIAFIGGQGLERPVERLQNALSSNFFANTEMFDERSQSTATTIGGEDREKFTKEFLEELQRKPNFQETIENPNPATVTEGTYIGRLVGTKLNYDDNINMVYSSIGQYFNVYQSTYNEIVKKYGLKLGSLFFSPTYRKIKDLEVYSQGNQSTPPKIEILGQYDPIKDLSFYSRGFKAAMESKIESVDLTTLIGFNEGLKSESAIINSNNILKPFVKKFINETIDGFTEIKSIKNLESVRNGIISAIDNVNYLVNYVHDGQVSGKTFTQANLSGYTYDMIYNEYSNLIDYVVKEHGNFTEDLDNTLNFNTPVISDSILSEFLSILLQGEKENIIKLYESDTTIFTDKVREKLGKIFDNFITVPKEKKFKLGKSPIRKNSKSVEFEIGSTAPITDTVEQGVLTNIFLSKNKLGKSVLNFYKP